MPKAYTEEYLIEKLQELSVALGRTPTYAEVEKVDMPAATCYKNHFGSYNKAVEKAGLTPNFVRYYESKVKQKEVLRILQEK